MIVQDQIDLMRIVNSNKPDVNQLGICDTAEVRERGVMYMLAEMSDWESAVTIDSICFQKGADVQLRVYITGNETIMSAELAVGKGTRLHQAPAAAIAM